MSLPATSGRRNNYKTRLADRSLRLISVLCNLRANAVQRIHRGEVLCSATVTISRQWHGFRETERPNQGRSSIRVRIDDQRWAFLLHKMVRSKVFWSSRLAYDCSLSGLWREKRRCIYKNRSAPHSCFPFLNRQVERALLDLSWVTNLLTHLLQFQKKHTQILRMSTWGSL